MLHVFCIYSYINAHNVCFKCYFDIVSDQDAHNRISESKRSNRRNGSFKDAKTSAL